MREIPGVIRCDSCQWSERVADVAVHMADHCPKCGAALMNDGDRAVVAFVRATVEAGLLRPRSDIDDVAGVAISIDTAGLHK